MFSINSIFNPAIKKVKLLNTKYNNKTFSSEKILYKLNLK